MNVPSTDDGDRFREIAWAQLCALAQKAEQKSAHLYQLITRAAVRRIESLDDLGVQQGRLREREEERRARVAVARTANATGHPEDLGRRGMPTVLLVLVGLLSCFGDYALDSSTLLVLGMSADRTRVLAAVTALAQLASAHLAGVALRRRHGSMATAGHLGPETFVAGALGIGGLATVGVLGVLRSWGERSSTISALTTLVGVVLFLAVTLVSYHHHNGLVDEARRAQAAVRRQQAVVNDAAEQAVRHAFAGRRHALELSALARKTIAEADRIRATAIERHLALRPGTTPPPLADPEAIARLRPLADGQYPAWVRDALDVPNNGMLPTSTPEA